MKCPHCDLYLSDKGWELLRKLDEATVEHHELP